MGTLIHLELYKLRTVRSTLVLLVVSQLVIAAGVTGLVLSSKTLDTPSAAPTALAHAGLASLFTLVLGILAVAGEYRNGTVTDTFLTTPRRSRVVLAKLVGYALGGAAFAVVNAVVALASTAAWWQIKGVAFDLTAPHVVSTLAGCFAWNIAFAVIGVGIGALARNLSAAVAGALAWLALVEGIVGQLVGDAARWLPFAAGRALGDLVDVGDALRPLSQEAALLVLATYALVLSGVAVLTSVRRDIT
jgi:ABC-2 type transport system permease protein